MLTTKDAAARLGVTARAVSLLIRSGAIKAQKFGRDWMIDPVEVERYLQERRPAHRPRKGGKE